MVSMAIQFLNPKPLKYCDNTGKLLYNAFEFEKIGTNEDIEFNGISTIEIKNYLSLNYNYLLSKNMEKNKFIKSNSRNMI